MLSANRLLLKRLALQKIIQYPRVHFGISYRSLQQSGTAADFAQSIRKAEAKDNRLPIYSQADGALVETACCGDNLQIDPKKVKTLKQVLPFDAVPGPKILKMIANLWKYIPAAGTQLTASVMLLMLSTGSTLTANRRMRNMTFFFDEYGPVVRIQGPFGGDLVLLNRPSDMQLVFQQEGTYPVRSALDSLERYRQQYRSYKFTGPYSSNGPEFEKLRKDFNSSFKGFLGQVTANIDKNSNDFVNNVALKRNRQDEVTADFKTEVFKWSLECIGNMMFSKPLGLVTSETTTQSDGVRLCNALQLASAAMMKCEYGLQMWKLYKTRSWRSLVENLDILDNLIGKNIRQFESELATGLVNKEKLLIEDRASLIKILLLKDNMKSDDVLTSLIDLLIIGVNSTTSAMSFLLFHLSRSQKSQRQLYRELINVMPKSDSEISLSMVKKLPYLQACIKESLRLVPPIPIITRVLSKNITIDGYNIPRGTYLLMATQDAGLKEENFEDAQKYCPERWLTPEAKDFHPFSTIPFGYGSRKCVGQEFAELQLANLTAKIIRNFRVEYPYGDIRIKPLFVSEPNKAMKLRFVDRE